MLLGGANGKLTNRVKEFSRRIYANIDYGTCANLESFGLRGYAGYVRLRYAKGSGYFLYLLRNRKS